MTRTAKLVNLAIAGIAKRATETVLRTARAMLGSTGWRVTRRVVEEHERDAEEAAAAVLDELAAMCTLLSLMAPSRPATDPRRDFLLAEPVRERARLLVTFEHIEATIVVYDWRPEGADARAGAAEPETGDMSSTWAVLSELGKLSERYTQHLAQASAAGHDATKLKARLDAARATLEKLLKKPTNAASRRSTAQNAATLRLVARTRVMPEFNSAKWNVGNGSGEKTQKRQTELSRQGASAKSDIDKYFTSESDDRKAADERLNALETYGGLLIAETADLDLAADAARRVIRDVRAALAPARASARPLAVVSLKEQQHWVLAHARTIGNVWLEAHGYAARVRHDGTVHAELGRTPRPIRPMPDTRTHYVLPCVPESGGLAYFVPTTGEGAMHELRPAARLHGDARPAASPLYDLSGRAASTDGARRYTMLEPGVGASSFGAKPTTTLSNDVKRIADSVAKHEENWLRVTAAYIGLDTAVVHATDADAIVHALKYMKKNSAATPDADRLRLVREVCAYLLNPTEGGTLTLAMIHGAKLTGADIELALFGKLPPYAPVTDATISQVERMYKLLRDGPEHARLCVRAGNAQLHTSVKWDVLKEVLTLLRAAHAQAGDDAALTRDSADTYLNFHLESTKQKCAGLYLFSAEHIFTLLHRDLGGNVELSDGFYQRAARCEWRDSLNMPLYKAIFDAMSEVQVMYPSGSCCCLPLRLLRKCTSADALFELACLVDASTCTCHERFVSRLDLRGLSQQTAPQDEHAGFLTTFFNTIVGLVPYPKASYNRHAYWGDNGDNAARASLLWNVGTTSADAKRKCAVLLADKYPLIPEPKPRYRLAYAYGFEPDKAEEMAHSAVADVLRDVFSIVSRKSILELLSFRNEHPGSSLFRAPALLAFADGSALPQWHVFSELPDASPEVPELAISMLTRCANVNRALLSMGLQDNIPCLAPASLVETLRLMRIKTHSSDKAYSAATRRLYAYVDADTRSSPLHHPRITAHAGVDDAGLWATLHLVELADPRTSGDEASAPATKKENEAILSFIEGKVDERKKNGRLLEVLTTQPWNRNRHADSAAAYYHTFLDMMHDGPAFAELEFSLKRRALAWRSGACVDAVALVCNGKVEGGLKTATQKSCAHIKGLDTILKLERATPQECELATTAMRSDTEVPACLSSEARQVGYDAIASLPRAMHGALLAVMKGSGEEVGGGPWPGAADIILPYIHRNLIWQCGLEVRYAYLAAFNAMCVGDDAALFKSTVAVSTCVDSQAMSFYRVPAGRERLRVPSGAYHWVQLANDITAATEGVGPAALSNPTSLRLSEVSRVFEAAKKSPTPDSFARFREEKAAPATESIANHVYENLLDADAAETLNAIRAAADGLGTTADEGVLRMDLFVSFAALEELVGLVLHERGTYVKWMLECALGARKLWLDARSRAALDVEHEQRGILQGDVGYILQKNTAHTRLNAAVRARYNGDVAELLKKFVTAASSPERLETNLGVEGEIKDDELAGYRVLSEVAQVYHVLTGNPAYSRLATSASAITAVPRALERMRMTLPISTQASAFRGHVESLQRDGRVSDSGARAILGSATVSDAQARFRTGFGARPGAELTTASAVVLDYVRRVEEINETPPFARLQREEQIADNTPIATTPAGRVELAVYQGGMYHLLGAGRWVRVLAGRYGDEGPSGPEDLHYTARKVYSTSGAFGDSKRLRRRGLGITLFESSVSAETMSKLLVEKDKVGRGTAVLWRLPCEGTCDSVVYVCATTVDRARSVMTLVVDRALSRVLEMHASRAPGVLSAIEATKQLKRLGAISDRASEWNFTFDAPRKRKPEESCKRDKTKSWCVDITTEVDVPELALLRCFSSPPAGEWSAPAEEKRRLSRLAAAVAGLWANEPFCKAECVVALKVKVGGTLGLEPTLVAVALKATADAVSLAASAIVSGAGAVMSAVSGKPGPKKTKSRK
jgi:hypothetical protein